MIAQRTSQGRFFFCEKNLSHHAFTKRIKAERSRTIVGQGSTNIEDETTATHINCRVEQTRGRWMCSIAESKEWNATLDENIERGFYCEIIHVTRFSAKAFRIQERERERCLSCTASKARSIFSAMLDLSHRLLHRFSFSDRSGHSKTPIIERMKMSIFTHSMIYKSSSDKVENNSEIVNWRREMELVTQQVEWSFRCSRGRHLDDDERSSEMLKREKTN